MAKDRPQLTMTEAAKAAGVSRDTIKRRHRTGAFPGAVQGAVGEWRIPVEELLAAGFTLHAPGPALGDEPGQHQEQAPGHDEAELTRLRMEAERWRAVAEERQAHIDHLVLALRALPPAPQVQAPGHDEAPGSARGRRRWWGRGVASA